MLKDLHGDVVLALDFLPQGLQVLQREHGQNATNDSQALHVVLFRIGPFLQVLSDGAEGIQNVLEHVGNRDGALQVSLRQIGPSGAI